MASDGPRPGMGPGLPSPGRPSPKSSAWTQSVNATAQPYLGMAQSGGEPSGGFPALHQIESQPAGEAGGRKKKKHRAGKKRRNRRPSFAAHVEDVDSTEMDNERAGLPDLPNTHSAARESFYRLARGQTSSTSLESEALLDHRDTGPLQARRQSLQGATSARQGSQLSLKNTRRQTTFPSSANNPSRSRLSNVQQASHSDEEETTDRTPLIGTSYSRGTGTPRALAGYGGMLGSPKRGVFGGDRRPQSLGSSRSSRRRGLQRTRSDAEDYDVNNPPSVPSSPKLGPDMGYDDVMLAGDEIDRGRSPEGRRPGDALIDIDRDGKAKTSTTPPSPEPGLLRRRMTMSRAEDDVCFPQEVLSEIADEDFRREIDADTYRSHRRRRRKWPDLDVLQAWATEEKEQRTLEGIRVRQVSEPLMVGGRLRPRQTAWHRDHEDAPFRFTYFNEDFPNTIHSQTISELLQPGQTFEDLFIPKPPLLSDDSSDEGESPMHTNGHQMDRNSTIKSPTQSALPLRSSTSQMHSRSGSQQQNTTSGQSTGHNTPVPTPAPGEKPKRYGPRPVFWLDVLCPTDAEMKVLSKTFGIHPLTAEDIMMHEAREKVELFRHYYFVNYRTFEQDANSEVYLEPVDMYVVVFREGVISFHFSQCPHPANVRRRIRQLSDYLFLTTDWISYAIIDDITDAYAPLIQRIEDEVDAIDYAILSLHAPPETADQKTKLRGKDKFYDYEKYSDAGDKTSGDKGGDMLRDVGECRKKVMSLYRLLGNKADVIKGFAKRCNEQWEIAPRSEIGLYLGDIQDHIVTMTSNLSHYENLLSRAHSNYLAQINIRMNERAEKTNDVLGKLTVLGTIVLPMNIVTGMWGMNVYVPGQDVHSLWWFWGITAFLFVFGLSSFLVAKRAYGIV